MHGDYEDADAIQLAECASILDEIDMLVHKDDIDAIKASIDSPDVREFRHKVNKFLSLNIFVTQSMLREALGITNDNFKYLYNRNATVGNKYLKKYLKPKVTEPYGESKTDQSKAELHVQRGEEDSGDSESGRTRSTGGLPEVPASSRTSDAEDSGTD